MEAGKVKGVQLASAAGAAVAATALVIPVIPPETLQFVEKVGVPGALAFFVLWKHSQTLEGIQSVLQEIASNMRLFTDRLAQHETRITALEEPVAKPKPD